MTPTLYVFTVLAILAFGAWAIRKLYFEDDWSIDEHADIEHPAQLDLQGRFDALCAAYERETGKPWWEGVALGYDLLR